jgi:hypothetical protein
MRAIVPSAVLALSLALCGLAFSQASAPATRPSEWKPLFNGKNLDGFYICIKGLSKGSDPDGYFKVENGAIHVLDIPVEVSATAPGAPTTQPRREFGYIATETEYSNYHLRFQYKWGEKRFPPRARSKRDAGVLYHVTGEDKVWPRGVECQVQEGDTGDVWIVGTNISLDTTVKSLEPNEKVFVPGGVPFTLTSRRIIKNPTVDSLTEWNSVDVIVKGNSAAHVVNGQLVARITDIQLSDTKQPLSRGKIAFQAEGAEVFYRNIEIKPLKEDYQLPATQAWVWDVNDRDRPRPFKAQFRAESEMAATSKPPPNAVVLFDGNKLDKWQPSTKPTSWKLEDGAVEIVRGSGDLITREAYGSCKLHLEFRTPNPPTGKDQTQGNSGIFFMSRYELQVLDNTNNPTYADGMAGAVYGQSPPMVDASRPSGEWNYYDIEFHAPQFDESGKLLKRARVTAHLNGVLVQDNFELAGPTRHGQRLPYVAHRDKEPLYLQNHGQVVRFRNIWIVPLE